MTGSEDTTSGPDSKQETRRQLLRVASVTGLSGLAGCSLPFFQTGSNSNDASGSDAASTPTPTRVDRTIAQTDAAKRHQSIVSTVNTSVGTAYRKTEFDYEPVSITPTDSAKRQIPYGTVRVAPARDTDGDRIWISEGEHPTDIIETLMRASLNIDSQIQISTRVSNATVEFTGSQNKRGVYGLIAHHQPRKAVLIVRARERSTAESLIQNFDESNVVPE